MLDRRLFLGAIAWGASGVARAAAPAAPDRPQLRHPDGSLFEFEPDLKHWCLSADGAWLLTHSGALLSLRDTRELRVVAQHPCRTKTGQPVEKLAASAALAARRSLVLAPAGAGELWELYLDPLAEDFYEGLVHDFRFGEGVPTQGYLGLRRMPMPEPLTRLQAHPQHFHLAACSASGQALLLNLDARRVAARLGPAWELSCAGPAPDTLVLSRGQGLRLIDLSEGRTLAQLELPDLPRSLAAGPGSLCVQLQNGQRLQLNGALQIQATHSGCE
ncbi:hypothetical protein HNQ51_000671 [Inhella inkyongensis]|uniref:Uncharacterized protein n=1 Tax=Inhella inkyongensis TaxID=392593 RepID=A0A840S1T3_9BURK|nr:hypothetical protein [Inhella inkyongensis]MBB5203378.1 hypothetical protein [Inhella inkyongensis]